MPDTAALEEPTEPFLCGLSGRAEHVTNLLPRRATLAGVDRPAGRIKALSYREPKRLKVQAQLQRGVGPFSFEPFLGELLPFVGAAASVARDDFERTDRPVGGVPYGATDGVSQLLLGVAVGEEVHDVLRCVHVVKSDLTQERLSR